MFDMDYEFDYVEYRRVAEYQDSSTEANVAPWDGCRGCDYEFNYGCEVCGECSAYRD